MLLFPYLPQHIWPTLPLSEISQWVKDHWKPTQRNHRWCLTAWATPGWVNQYSYQKPSHNTSLQQRGKNRNSTAAVKLLNKPSINLFKWSWLKSLVWMCIHLKEGYLLLDCASHFILSQTLIHSSISCPHPSALGFGVTPTDSHKLTDMPGYKPTLL